MTFKTRVFVVMPFGVKDVVLKSTLEAPESTGPVKVDFDAVYDTLLKPALEMAGCQPFRADKEQAAGDIRTDMFFELLTADIVLADISALNANVFYELGVRHGVSPHGVFVTHGGWGFARPFDIAPDRAFRYDGTLFDGRVKREETWSAKAAFEAKTLGSTLRAAIAHDGETTGSPVYASLPGLTPVGWSQLHSARSKYFGGILVDWEQRIRLAQAEGYPGDILTLAEDAPTRLHREKLLYAAARGLIDLCRFDAAEPVLREVLALSPQYLEAKCQLGLALGRQGKTSAAVQHMERVVQQHRNESEGQGILGRVYKDMWRFDWERKENLESRQQEALATSERAAAAIRNYYAALELRPQSYYNGINVLTLTFLIAHLERVTGGVGADLPALDLDRIKAVVRFSADAARRRAIESNDQSEQIWSAATLGELALLDGNLPELRRRYGEACSAPSANFFQKQSMLGQLQLMRGLGYLPSAVEAALLVIGRSMPQEDPTQRRFERVFVFSGHMTDRPGREQPRFPAEKEAAVRERLEAVLSGWSAGPGDLALTGAARGGDILFAEICQARGVHVRILLPKREGEFVEDSVRVAGGNWEPRFFRLVKNCEHWYQDEHLGAPPEGTSPHTRNNLWILNTGRAEARPREIYGLLVWDEASSGDGPGGTSHFASEIRRLDGQVEIVNPMRL